MGEALCKPRTLNCEGLLAPLVKLRWDKWRRVYFALQLALGLCDIYLYYVEAVVEIDERGVASALVEDVLDIDVGNGQASVANETLACCNYLTILGNDAITRKYEVGRRFANTCRCVDVAA